MLQKEEQQLQKFISENTVQNCEQRSVYWYKLRQNSFGGSQVASLMGTKNYISQTQFLKDMVQKRQDDQQQKQFNMVSQNIMDFGSFFESVHRLVIMQVLDCQIYETSMSQGKNILNGCHQSPDGLGVVSMKKFRENVTISPQWNNREIFKKESLTVLFEQKCPSYRNPIDGQIPEHYIGQVKLGLEIFNICDIGLYSDAVFNVCSFSQMFGSGFNRNIIPKRFVKTIPKPPKFIGYISIPIHQTSLIGLKRGDISSDINDTVFNTIMGQIKQQKFNMKYGVFKYEKNDQLKQQIISQLDDTQYSYIFWKLNEINYTAVEKSNGFIKMLVMFLAIGRRTLELENPSDKNNPLKKFCKAINKLHIPLLPENSQDKWYLQHKDQILTLFEQLFSDDFQSFHVLIYLLRDSNTQKHIQLADHYTLQAIEIAKSNENKLQQIIPIIKHIDQSFNTSYLKLIPSNNDTTLIDIIQQNNDIIQQNNDIIQQNSDIIDIIQQNSDIIDIMEDCDIISQSLSDKIDLQFEQIQEQFEQIQEQDEQIQEQDEQMQIIKLDVIIAEKTELIELVEQMELIQ